jgi:hypothetical protein
VISTSGNSIRASQQAARTPRLREPDQPMSETRWGDTAYDVAYTYDPAGNRLTKEEVAP